MRNRDESGMVTAELAGTSLIVGLAMVIAGWVGGLGYTWLRCSDTAAAIARQEARSDLDAVAAAKQAAPEHAVVTIDRVKGMVTVTVTLTTEAWGYLLPAIPIIGVAHVAVEE